MPVPYWKDEELPEVLRDFSHSRGPYLELVLLKAADEIERLRQLIDDQNGDIGTK